MIEAIKNRRILPGLSVAVVDTGYRRYAAELYPHQTLLERNCSHVIYERLRIADSALNSFDTDFRSAKAEGVIQDPFVAFLDKLEALIISYDVVKKLIESFLVRSPEDVFEVWKIAK